MQKKFTDFGKLWDSDSKYEQWVAEQNKKPAEFDYTNIDSVTVFTGTHPAVMKDLINKEDWKFEADIKKKNFKNVKHMILYFIWRKFGWRPFEYSNYKRI